jgi:hypothetical protein
MIFIFNVTIHNEKVEEVKNLTLVILVTQKDKDWDEIGFLFFLPAMCVNVTSVKPGQK